jgi:hypothetical protein
VLDEPLQRMLIQKARLAQRRDERRDNTSQFDV